MKVGIILPTGYPWDRIELARVAAETMGADSLWTVDHFLSLHHPDIWRQMPLITVRPDPDAFF
jgi:hypothetical protein